MSTRLKLTLFILSSAAAAAIDRASLPLLESSNPSPNIRPGDCIGGETSAIMLPFGMTGAEAVDTGCAVGAEPKTCPLLPLLDALGAEGSEKQLPIAYDI
jgi:hypothetical protein